MQVDLHQTKLAFEQAEKRLKQVEAESKQKLDRLQELRSKVSERGWLDKIPIPMQNPWSEENKDIYQCSSPPPGDWSWSNINYNFHPGGGDGGGAVLCWLLAQPCLPCSLSSQIAALVSPQ